MLIVTFFGYIYPGSGEFSFCWGWWHDLRNSKSCQQTIKHNFTEVKQRLILELHDLFLTSDVLETWFGGKVWEQLDVRRTGAIFLQFESQLLVHSVSWRFMLLYVWRRLSITYSKASLIYSTCMCLWCQLGCKSIHHNKILDTKIMQRPSAQSAPCT